MRGLYFFFSILTLVSCSTFKVIGFCGHNVTLPCSYDTETLGVLSFCWGQGMVPTFKCFNTILSSEDGVVQFRQSPRYQLLGWVTEGDVSLTILNAQMGDAGVYGCRVEIPGLFNDHKANTRLVMEEAPVEQAVTEAWTLLTGGTQETLTTSTPKNVEVGDPTFDRNGTAGQIKAILEVENIGKLTAIFFFPIIIILIFILRRGFLQRKTLQHLDTSAAENVYECIPEHG